MDVLGAFQIFLFLESVLGNRMFRKMSKIYKPTWNLATKKQISKPDRLQCALTCTGEKDVCNAVHFEALNNTCFIAKLTLLEEPPREESFPVYMETKALKSLEEKENFLLLGREVNCLQSFPCNFALPVLEFEFGLGGIAVLNGKVHIHDFTENKCNNRGMVSYGTWDETNKRIFNYDNCGRLYFDDWRL